MSTAGQKTWMRGLLFCCSLVLVTRPVFAEVHGGGVAACNYCHDMHGQSLVGSGDGLLLEESASDVCLACHAETYGAVLGTDPLAPPPERGAGNFVFLWEDNLNDGADGVLNPISGDAAGHNIDAPGHGLSADGSYLNSPGGSFPSGQLGCTSCHDPHGNTSYRFLRGPDQPVDGAVFLYPAYEAAGIPFDGSSERPDNHIAYQAGVSNWCGNCHGDYLNNHNETGGFEHPTDETLPSGFATRYNRYNGTADSFGGDASTAYLPEVPFQDPSTTVSGTAGPSTSSRVMCLSCHRAHATSGPHAGRWDFNVDTLGQDGVVSGSYPLPNPYPDPNQDPLCRKCHSGMMGG